MQPASSVLSLTSHTTWDLFRRGRISLLHDLSQEHCSRTMFEEHTRTLHGISPDMDALRSVTIPEQAVHARCSRSTPRNTWDLNISLATPIIKHKNAVRAGCTRSAPAHYSNSRKMRTHFAPSLTTSKNAVRARCSRTAGKARLPSTDMGRFTKPLAPRAKAEGGHHKRWKLVG